MTGGNAGLRDPLQGTQDRSTQRLTWMVGLRRYEYRRRTMTAPLTIGQSEGSADSKLLGIGYFLSGRR